MNAWKLVVGAGAACAACCAAPLLGGIAAWVLPWSVATAAWASRAGGVPALAALLLAGTVLGAGIAVWRRRKRRAVEPGPCGCPPGRCGAAG